MTDPISGNSLVSQIMSGIDLGPTDSIQFNFAKLQMAQAQICKGKANDYMKQIENAQAEQKKVAEMISEMRKLQEQCKDGGTVELTPELRAYMEEHDLAIQGTETTVIDYRCIEGKCGDLCAEEWAAKTWASHVPGGHVEPVKMPDGNTCYQMVSDDYERKTSFTVNADNLTFNLQSLTNYQESISNQTQTLMVYLQDFISQYNSYTQGATSMISNAGQVLTSVATGR